jgi:hypothetical protein
MLAAVVAVSAQSLGELARQEEARRKAIKAPGKVYTTETLTRSGQNVTPPPPAATQPAQTPAPAAGAQASTPSNATDPNRTEAYWRKRIESERTALSRAEIFADALQSRINALSADFTARDDPAQRAVIANDRDKALAELERVKQEIQQRTKAITAIQEEARKAGVPAGWVR